jgi:hypothetical protein
VPLILTAHSPAGADTSCPAYYNPLMLQDADFDNLHMRVGRLGDAGLLYDNPEVGFSPSNLWAGDRSWVACTDYDLWATKVAGPARLMSPWTTSRPRRSDCLGTSERTLHRDHLGRRPDGRRTQAVSPLPPADQVLY